VILSPFVAGVGLTIVEANHVIHYGRWWNPAVEAQATDRAYRLGQVKDVTVYLPILRDATRRISRTFDQLLDELMDRKKGLAEGALEKDDFLVPQENEEEAGLQVCSGLVSSINSDPI
jgi:SNF2 family DNA or RNA helicase